MAGKRNKGSGSKLLIGIFAGLVIGVLIAFGVVLYLNKSTLPFEAKSGRPDQQGLPGKDGQALPLPGKPGDTPNEKPRFEFYKILPGTQEPTPGDTVPPAPVAGDGQTVPTTQPDLFYLQAGAFSKAADADNLKAKLALMGVEASVQDVMIPEKGTLHRVRTGPYPTPNEMNEARTLMSQNGVQTTPIKVKNPTYDPDKH